jgi:RNA polymerase sigma-70 factor (ECF subfamily)
MANALRTRRLDGGRPLVTAAADEFARLVEAHRLRAFRFALQIVGNPDDAMELTQEAFFKAHRQWHRFDPSRSFGPWFYAILRNLAIDFLRRRRPGRDVELDEVAEASPAPGPDVLAERSEIGVRLWEAIGRLPYAQREALVLRELHGLGYAEIAQVTGAPVTTVNSRLHHARQALRREMEKYL